MKFRPMRTLLVALAIASSGAAVADPTPSERVMAVKSILQASTQALHQYQWIETTVVSLDGEEKSQTVKRCYYGPDGTVTKMQLSTTPPPETKRGLRGRIRADKEAEMKTFMQGAVALIHTYVPPDPVKLQEVQSAGNLNISPKPNQQVLLTFSSYNLPGDSLSIDLDLADDRLLNANVSSYLDTQDQPITLAVTWGVMPNGISYVANSALNAPSKKLTVTVTNSDYVAVAE